MSWVISLGAGREQIPLIRAIQAEGFKCLAVDRDRVALVDSKADAISAVSNRDIDGILKACKYPKGDQEPIVGVMAAGSEVPDVMAILAFRLGLPGVPVATGMLLKDKLAYKRVLKDAGVPHTEAHEIHGGSVKELFDKLKYEVVVKPRSGSGSRGVFLNRHDPMGLTALMADSAEASHYDLIMERYQEGPQISSETLIWDGKAVTVAFVDRFYAEFGKELGGSNPSEWASQRPSANALIQDAARALGITRGTIKSDLVLTEDGPKIIELTCRLSGGPLSELVRQSTGVDYLRQAVRIAVGKEPEWEFTTPLFSGQLAMNMNGKDMDWKESRKYIVRELGRVAR